MTAKQNTDIQPAKITDRLELSRFSNLDVPLGIPIRHRSVDLAGVYEDYREKVVESIESLFTLEPKGLFMAGDVGVGKTAILRIVQQYFVWGMAELAKSNEHPQEFGVDDVFQCDAVFLSHFELVKQLREYHSNKDVNSRPLVYSTNLLLLDDLGRGYDDQSGWNLALLDEFFDDRWSWGKPTCVTTNKSWEELQTWPGWGRIIDRLTDPSWMIVLNMGTGSRRKSKA